MDYAAAAHLGAANEAVIVIYYKRESFVPRPSMKFFPFVSCINKGLIMGKSDQSQIFGIKEIFCPPNAIDIEIEWVILIQNL